MNILYISDLDGTLLNQEALLSEEAYIRLKNLMDAGVHFTCATARTAATVVPILHGLSLSAPAILMNGVAILDWPSNTYVKVEYLNPLFSQQLIKKLEVDQLSSFIYTIDTNQLHTYYTSLSNTAMHEFYTERVTRYQKPFTQISSLTQIQPDFMIYSLLLNKKETLLPLCDWLDSIKDLYQIDFCFYPEIYLKDTWCLEIFSSKATKFNAVQYLRHQYGYDKIVGFGDNLNDLPLFKACDDCYAVSNAKEEVKAAANAVIGSNIDCSVPKFIEQMTHRIE